MAWNKNFRIYFTGRLAGVCPCSLVVFVSVLGVQQYDVSSQVMVEEWMDFHWAHSSKKNNIYFKKGYQKYLYVYKESHDNDNVLDNCSIFFPASFLGLRRKTLGNYYCIVISNKSRCQFFSPSFLFSPSL